MTWISMRMSELLSNVQIKCFSNYFIIFTHKMQKAKNLTDVMINVEFTCLPSLNKLQYQFPHLLTLTVNKLSPSIVIQDHRNLSSIFSNG